jgi:hypothetical protein
MKVKIKNLIFYFSRVIAKTQIALLCLILIFQNFSSLYAQKNYPVKINTYIDPPYSPYFDDYFSASGNKWKLNILFHDFSEPEWDVKLRITIESSKLKIETRSTFIPSSPLRIFPGIPLEISGTELAQYFQYNNLVLNGITASELSNNGKFPEGFYSFCIEVLDYKTGVALSLKSCTSIWIQLNDEPITVTPVCGNVIKATPTQNIIFQWHQSNSVSPNSVGTEYKLIMYEVTDNTINPLYAIQNNKVLKVFESEFLNQNTFLYDMTDPILDPGKKYVYTVQAKDIEGKDLFKNEGISQPCWFWYGYPSDGMITLEQPLDKSSFKLSDPAFFKWSSPDKIIPKKQYFSYDLKIVKVDSTQTAEEAMQMNQTWYEETTNLTNRLSSHDLVINKKLEPQTIYAWQVKAFTDGQVIAKSPVHIYHGPGIIEGFLAGDHEVMVNSTDNLDLNHLSGTGLVKTSENGKTQLVKFNDLRIIKTAGRYVLDYGTITADLSDTSLIELLPDLKENNSAWFHPRKMRLDKDVLEFFGYVSWQLPHITSEFKVVQVTSKNDWVNFDKLKLNGGIKLNSSNRFTLLDPYLFGLNLFTTSDFLINDNKYYLRYDGEIVLPDNVKGTNINEGNIRIAFKQAGQLFYITNSNVSLSNNIMPLPNSNLVVAPLSNIIDLSELVSPLKLSDKKEWKGVYFPKFRIDFNTDADKFGQLIFKKSIQENYELVKNDNYKNWVGGDGLYLSVTKNFTTKEEASFNKFPASLNLFKLEIEKCSVQNGSITGSIIIPFISAKNKFAFLAPISNAGIQPGYLDSLDGTKFIFNEGSGDQETFITITRAVFADRERLDMTLNLEWPSLSVNVNSLTGFKAWGNYNIGFLFPNGTMSLTNQANGLLGGYPVTFDGIGAGNSNGAYAFGITGKVVLAEDISGDQGPPAINIYSTMPNSMLPQIAYIQDSDTSASNIIPADITQDNYEDNLNTIKNNFVKNLYQSNMTSSDDKADLSMNFSGKSPDVNYEATDLINHSEPAKKDSTWGHADFTFSQQALIDEVIAAVTIAMAQPFTDTITSKINKELKIFTDKVDKVRDSINIKIEREIHKLLDTLAGRTARKLKTADFDPTAQINLISDSLSIKLSNDIKINITKSIDNNIKIPVTSFINKEISGRTNGLIQNQVRLMLVNLLDGKVSFSKIVNNLADDIPSMVTGIGKDVGDAVNIKKMKGDINNLADDAIGNIKVNDINNILIRAIDAEASKIVSKYLSKISSKAINNLVNKITNNDGGVSASAGVGIKMNFKDLGRNLKEGRVDKIVKLDAVSIALKTKFVSFAGLIKYSAGDAVYGNIWKGDIVLNINLPKKFALEGIYINGRKDDIPYWFCQISGADSKQKPGGALDKVAKPLTQPVLLGPVKLVGASGRLYHHMSEIPGQAIIPDANTAYGAFMNFIFFDANNNGTSMRLSVGAGVEIKEDGNYVIDFEGDVEAGNKNPQVTVLDPLAMGAGGLSLNYNSAESHFLGKGWLIIKSKSLCAKGNFLVDVKPDYWLVQIGSRDDMIMITPGCIGWGAAGWVGVNQTTANIGLGLSYSLSTDLGIDLKAVKGGLHIDAGAAAGIEATAQYKPDFKLLQAGIWIDLWANIAVYYSTAAKSGSFNLVNINCKGDLLMTFDPPPTNIAGTLHGHVEILCFGIDFDSGFEKTLN